MWQQDETEAQDVSLTVSLPSQKQAPEPVLHTEEEQARLRPDIFRAEALQYYKSQKNDPAPPIRTTTRFSVLLWLALAILLLGLITLGILLTIVAKVPVLGLGKGAIAV